MLSDSIDELSTTICFRKKVKAIRSAAYVNHWVHRYPGKLIPHIPRYFLEKETKENPRLVLDPFCGSGTVLVEAMLAGHNAVGIDINPLACFLSRVKTKRLDQKRLESLSNSILRKTSLPTNDIVQTHNFYGIDYWFSEDVKNKLCRIKKEIETISQSEYRDFFRLVFSSLIRKTSFADPRIPPACKSKRMRKKIENDWNPKVQALFEKTLNNAVKCHQEFLSLCVEDVNAEVINANSGKIPLSDESIDLVITSPPYINAQKYLRSTRNEILWLGLINEYERLRKMDKALVGTERVYKHEFSELIQPNILLGHKDADKLVLKIGKINWRLSLIVFKFFFRIKTVIEEMYRLLTSKAKAIIVIGNNTIGGIKVPTNKILVDMASKVGFKLERIFVDDIISRGLMTKRNKTANIINSEWVLVLHKGT